MPNAVADLITRVKDFNPEEITIGSVKTNKQGGKSIPIYYKGEKPVLQFPKTNTWGLVGQTPLDKPNDPKKYSVNLRLTRDSDFCRTMIAFENQVIKWITAHAGECLGQADQPEAVIRALFYPLVKYPKDKDTGKVYTDRDPTLKLKVAYWDGVWKVELYDSERNEIFMPGMTTPSDPDDPDSEPIPVDPTDPELCPSGTEMVGLMQCNGIWVAAGRCGVTFQLLQAQTKQPVRIKGFAIQPDSDDEDAEDAEDAGEGSDAGAASGDAAAVPDSDGAEGEGDDDGDGEPEVEEAPAPKKTKRTRKKAGAAA